MRKEYDFSRAEANPYIKRLRKDETRLTVDDNEMEEILSFEEDLKRGQRLETPAAVAGVGTIQ